MTKDTADLLFRVFFSLIFLALGAEHIASDELVQKLMPEWMPMPGMVSILVGLVLSVGGICIVLGWKLRFASLLLGAFILVATVIVHLPAVFMQPEFVDTGNQWMWDILQRTNLAKNVCLLGVCILLWHHQPGKWSLDSRLRSEK